MSDITYIGISFIISFAIAFAFIPTIVRVSKRKQLLDKPDTRSSHNKLMPNLGGLAIFAGFIITASLLVNTAQIAYYQYIIAAIIVIFFVGLKDDILIIAPLTKFTGQIIAALIIVVFANIRISDFHGFFDIHEISYATSIVFSLFVILVVVNGFNFIDGVDGLSASITIITASTFGIWFLIINELQLSIIAFSLVGSVVAFFIFNVFGTTNKIFMGDTGSLIIGLIMSILAIEFNELNLDKTQEDYLYTAPTIAFCILIIPIFDLLRIMFVRLIQGRSIFKADKNHLHHQLLRLGCNHAQITLIISTLNVFFIVFAFYTAQFLSIQRQLLLVLIIAIAISITISELISRKKRK